MAATTPKEVAPFDENTTTSWYIESPVPPEEAAASSSSSEAASSSSEVEASSSSSEAAPSSAPIRRTVVRPVNTDVKFEAMGLKEDLLKGLFAASFEHPSAIQASAIPKILKSPSTHLLVEAQSGAGKTLAFVVPALQRIDLAKKSPQAVFVLPTRELATQVRNVTLEVGKFLPGLSVQLVVKEDKDTAKLPFPLSSHILVGTPGTLCNALTKKKFCPNPKQITLMAIDEADQMIPEDKQEAHVMCAQLVKARQACSPKCQLLFMSATFPENVGHFQKGFFNGQPYEALRIAADQRVVQTIQQYYIPCSDYNAKLRALYKIYTSLQIPQSIIFVRTRESSTRLNDLMTKEGFAVSDISGSKSPAERDFTFKQFLSGAAKVLIATNVMARGIDVRTVSLIINFDPPTNDKDGKVADVDNYFHRVGRTGRFGDQGLAINLVASDQDMGMIRQFEKAQGKPIKEYKADDIPALQAFLDEISEENLAKQK